MPPNAKDFVDIKRVILSLSKARFADDWLKDKQTTDGAEDLWRIHDKLYDVSEFIQRHPGGAEWLELTKGTDVTEAFEVHHLSTYPEELLKKYYVKEAETPRSSRYTFKNNGFYRTLKHEIQKKLKDVPQQQIRKTSDFFTDSICVFMFIFAIMANSFWNYKLGILAGIILSLLANAAHNYFHQKNNYRMFYFTFSLLQIREWRVSHVLSHHLHTNTSIDMQITIFDPVIQYFPKGNKNIFNRFLPWIIFPLVWCTCLHQAFLLRIGAITRGNIKLIRSSDIIPFSLPLVMYLMGDKSIFDTIWMWTFIIIVASFFFVAVGANAAHHHPDIFHHGDTPRIDDDWGLNQLDTVMDRKEITGSHFLVLTSFGDHCLHHLFPSLDHGILDYLYPTFKEVCHKFNVNLRMNTQLNMIKGQFLQAARNRPNPNPPDLFKKY